MKSRPLFPLLFAAALAFSACAHAQLSVRDDVGRVIILQKPATRVVTLAPFLTEIVFAVGAGNLAVGVDQHSDYPPEVFSTPKVPTGASFSLERITALKPDLVLAWRDGIRKEDIAQLAGSGTHVFVATAHQLEDVTRLMRTIGQLTGRDPNPSVAAFETRIDKLRRDNAGKQRLTAFLEIWNRPLTTVSGEHFLTEALEICGAENVFKERRGVAPKVAWTDVEQKAPYLIIGAGSASSLSEFRQNWVVRQSLAAVKAERLLFIPDETIARPSPRTPEGIAKLCAGMDNIRAGRVQRMVDTSLRTAQPQGVPLKGPGLGFIPSLTSPVTAPPATSPKGALAAPAAPETKASPPAAANPAPPPPVETPPKRPSQYGL